jgi:hypothetical protein
MRELLNASGADPLAPDSEDVVIRISPRINADRPFIRDMK